MAQHKVKLSTQAKLPVLKGDVRFDIMKNGKAFGTLLVSQGSVVWRPKWKSVRTHRLNWTELDQVFKNKKKKVK